MVWIHGGGWSPVLTLFGVIKVFQIFTFYQFLERDCRILTRKVG